MGGVSSALFYNPGGVVLGPRGFVPRDCPRGSGRGRYMPGRGNASDPNLPSRQLSKSDPAARPEGEGRAKRRRKSPLSDSGLLPPLAPELRLLPGGAASAIRPGRGPGSGINRQLQETSSRGHVARPPPPPRPLVGFSGRTQSPPFQASGPRGQAGSERGGRRGCGSSFRGAGFGGRG